MDKKYVLVGSIWVILIVGVLLTNSFFPPLVKENFDLYRSHEYSQMYLESDPYEEIVIEYDYVSGYGPTKIGVDTLEEKIEEHTEKERIESVEDDIIDLQDTRVSYDKNTISELNEEYRDHERGGNTIPIHVLYLNGHWKKNRKALGLSKKPHSIVIFRDVVNSFAGQSVSIHPDDVESSVLVHEFGHLLSLVGTDYDSDHQAEDSYHCNEEAGECVMAATVQFKDEEEQEPPPTDFCELCEEDLEHIKSIERDFGFVDVMTYSLIGIETVIAVGASINIILWKEEKEPPGPTYGSSEWRQPEGEKGQWENNTYKER